MAPGAGITRAHALLHLRDLQVPVELHGDERAVGLLHVHLVRAVTRIGLDPVHAAAGNGPERRRTERRGRRGRDAFLVRPDWPGAARSRSPRMTARGRRGTGTGRGRAAGSG